jgi:hypothetical protein
VTCFMIVKCLKYRPDDYRPSSSGKHFRTCLKLGNKACGLKFGVPLQLLRYLLANIRLG